MDSDNIIGLCVGILLFSLPFLVFCFYCLRRAIQLSRDSTA